MKYIIIIFLAIGFLGACTDVIIPDIGNEMANHITPVDAAVLQSGDVQFQWEFIDFADSTRFTLVSPSFIDPQFTCADTFLTSDRITLQLPSDQYEWKTVGYNDAFTSEQVVSSFEVVTDQTLWLGEDAVILESPVSDFRTNSDSITLVYMALAGVDEYEVTIKDAAGMAVKTMLVTTTTAKFEIEDSGQYTWTVLGHNLLTSTTTKIGEERSFEIDRVGLEAPLLLIPAMMDTVALKEMGPHLTWDPRGGLMSSVSLQVQDGNMDTLFQNLITDTEVSLSKNLINIFTQDTVMLNLSIFTKDDLGNHSDTLRKAVVVRK